MNTRMGTSYAQKNLFAPPVKIRGKSNLSNSEIKIRESLWPKSWKVIIFDMYPIDDPPPHLKKLPSSPPIPPNPPPQKNGVKQIFFTLKRKLNKKLSFLVCLFLKIWKIYLCLLMKMFHCSNYTIIIYSIYIYFWLIQ